MKLFILRHGEAGAHKQSDQKRELTNKGIHDARLIGNKLKTESINIDAIFVSPYVRTQQTLDNFLYQYGSVSYIDTHSALIPEGKLGDIYNLLSGLDENGCVMLISHLPLVSILVANLVAGNNANIHQYPMSPASLAEIDLECCGSGCGVLKRLISPPYDY